MASPAPGLKIATLRGVPVYIGRTWPLIALVIVALFGPQVNRLHPEWGIGGYLLALAYAVLLLVSVLFHEGAHALAGQACGYRVNRIVADLWGGHTMYDTDDATPGRSALVAAVGPLSNALLALAGWLALQQVDGDGAWPLLLAAFTWSNGFVAVFNALPGLPLDGGFVVDALVWKITGSRAKGMKAAGWCGRAVAVGVVIWALAQWSREGGFGSIWTLVWTFFIASFLWRGAGVAVTVGNNRELLSGIHLRDVARPARGIAATTSVADLLESADTLVLLDDDNLPEAVIPPGAHVRVPMDRRHDVPASALSEALVPGAFVEVKSWDDDVIGILPTFESQPTPGLVVLRMVDPVGTALHVVGVVMLTDLQRVLGERVAAR